jgi:putative endonuclease
MRERVYFAYVMSSLSRTLYTGVTNDLERRVAEHKEGKPGSFTARYNLRRLVYFERFDYIDDAIASENGIRRMLRAQKIALIESMNPRWQDLSDA